MEKILLTKAKPKKLCDRHKKEACKDHDGLSKGIYDTDESLKTKRDRVMPREKTPREIVMTKATLIEFLKENLKLSVGQAAGGFTDPNARRIELKLDDEVISYVEFDVRQKREYEG